MLQINDEDESIPKRVVLDILNYSYLSSNDDDFLPSSSRGHLHLATPENTFIEYEPIIKPREKQRPNPNSKIRSLNLPLNLPKANELITSQNSYLYPFHGPSKTKNTTFLTIRARSLQPQEQPLKLDEQTKLNSKNNTKVVKLPNIKTHKSNKPRQKCGFKFDSEKFRNVTNSTMTSYESIFKKPTTQTIASNFKPDGFKQEQRKAAQLSDSINSEINRIIRKYPSIFLRRAREQNVKKKSSSENLYIGNNARLRMEKLPILVANMKK